MFTFEPHREAILLPAAPRQRQPWNDWYVAAATDESVATRRPLRVHTVAPRATTCTRFPGHNVVRATGLEPARLFDTRNPNLARLPFFLVIVGDGKCYLSWTFANECRRVVASFGLFCTVPLAIR